MMMMMMMMMAGFLELFSDIRIDYSRACTESYYKKGTLRNRICRQLANGYRTCFGRGLQVRLPFRIHSSPRQRQGSGRGGSASSL
jgi:hypothetical protein